MTIRFNNTETLPATGCTRDDIYSLIKTLDAVAGLVSAPLTVTGGAVTAALLSPRWEKVGDAVGFADFSVASHTNDIQLFLAVGAVCIHAVKIKQSTQFVGTGISKVELTVGVAANLAKYAAPFDVGQAVGDTVFGLSSELGGETHDAGGTSIRLAAEAFGADLDQLSAGVVDVWVMHSATL